jgi:hypothetical protein
MAVSKVQPARPGADVACARPGLAGSSIGAAQPLRASMAAANLSVCFMASSATYGCINHWRPRRVNGIKEGVLFRKKEPKNFCSWGMWPVRSGQ